MSEHDRDPSAKVREALRAAAPPAPFDSGAMRERIRASIEHAGPSGGPWWDRGRIRLWVPRMAAAIALFAGGVATGVLVADSETPGPVIIRQMAAGGGTLGDPTPSEVPLSIQAAGTRYVASVALLTELQDRLTPAQLDEAREVAFSALSGALAELVGTRDDDTAGRIVQTLLSRGLPARAGSDPIVWYR